MAEVRAGAGAGPSSGGGPPSSARRLPRGRHGLSREEVANDQRDRIMAALADAMVAEGYGATTVADVLRGARVSRESFYQHFSSKLDCFLHTFDAAADLLVATIASEAPAAPVGSRQERFAEVFGRYLDLIVEHQAYARLFLVESYAAGPAAIERRAAVQGRLTDELAVVLGLETERDRFAAQALVAAVATLVTGPLVAGDLAAIAALREPVLALAADLFP